MSDPNDGRGERGSRKSPGPGFSVARGAALVGVAVILGVVLLNFIDDGNDGPVGDGGASSTTTTTVASTSGSTGTDATGSTTPTTAAVVPPAEVTVRVLNGSGVNGAASTLTNTLKAKGYKTLLAGDASPRTGSVVYAVPTRTAACTTMSANVPDAKVQAMPTPVPGGQDADCIVVIGS